MGFQSRSSGRSAVGLSMALDPAEIRSLAAGTSSIRPQPEARVKRSENLALPQFSDCGHQRRLEDAKTAAASALPNRLQRKSATRAAVIVPALVRYGMNVFVEN